ncbi:death-associated protein kinase 1-like, partial [Limulus polyphemus]|uniref:Death-associated protein kinase 1-like n=1 Tax=Limulus polyphemus TaxID=6850 RepID=A0ABM1TPX7_LIMPO
HGETAVHIAAGLGQLEIVKFLHSHGADISLLDSHGDSAIYWAARQGHSEVIKYLFEQRVSVDTQNKAGETALHVAARYGHSDTLKLLCKFGANYNMPDEHGETALHIAVWHGFPRIVFVLCEVGASPNLKNKEEETPLHCATARGHAESVRCLLEAGADVNLLDKNGCTPLHLATRRHHVVVAMLLLQASCQVDVVDHHGEAPIHIVAREGLLPLAQNLCAFGCRVDIPNQDGIPAEITALAQGFTDIGELLNRLRNEQLREDYIAQLIPTTQPISRVKLKLFGHSGVGKTTLVDSLKCGYFSSFFRRSRASSPTPSDHRKSKNSCNSSTSSIELSVATSNSIPLIFETNMEYYTKGVDIQQLSIPGVGDLSVWEFSGHEPYFIVYDHFIGNTNCLHAIVFRMNDPPEVRYQQILFWLHFLQVRIPPIEPLSYCGRSKNPAKVVLIATHADVAGIYRNSSSGEYMNTEVTPMLQDLRKQFENILDLHDTVYITDAHVAGSPGMKHLKQYLSTEKVKVVQNLPKQTGFLDSMISHLPSWRKSSAVFPVLSWQQFVDMVHLQINPLAGEDHMKELITQLQLTGEVLYLKSESQDVVVLNPRWLCVDVVGQLLSHDHLQQARVTGCYTVDDIQLLFPETDALDLLQVLEALHLCTQCESDGDIEYEFPVFNLVETLEGLWDENDLRYHNGVYGGVQIRPQAGMCHVIPRLFPRVQVQLRRSIHQHPDPENDLYQWHLGSKFCSGCLEGIITLTDHEAIEIKVRGPNSHKIDSFYFLEDLLSVVDQVLGDICPGLVVERHFLSASQLQSHVDNPVSFPPDLVMKQLIKNGPDAVIERENVQEKVLDLFCSGATELQRYLNPDSGVSPGLTLAPDIHVSHLSVLTRQNLCAILDPPESMGRDWCMLGVRLGMTDELPHIDPGENSRNSPTARTLEQWSKNPNSTIKSLLSKLEELGREDAIQIILKCGPLFKVRPSEVEIVAEDVVIVGAGSHTSSSNLSR